MNNKEMQASISRPKDSVSPSSLNKIIKYNELGISDEKNSVKIEDDFACAYVSAIGPKKIYKIKANRKGELYNPQLKSFTYGLNKRDRLTNELMFTYKEVSENKFKLYTKFLKDGQSSLLIAAQRE